MKKIVLLSAAVLSLFGTSMLQSCLANATKVPQTIFSSGGGNLLKPSSEILNKSINLAAYNKIEIGGAFDVVYEVSAGQPKADLSFPANYEKFIHVSSDKGKLKIETVNCQNVSFEAKKIHIFVSGPIVTDITISGASSLYIKNEWESTAGLELNMSGASSAKFEENIVLGGELELGMSGAATLSIQDIRCTDLEIEGSGACKLNLQEVSVNNKISADINGTASVVFSTVISSAEIDAELSGASSLKITSASATPIFDLETSGTSVIKINDVNANKIEASSSGVSSIVLTGKAKSIQKSTSGVSKIKFNE